MKKKKSYSPSCSLFALVLMLILVSVQKSALAETHSSCARKLCLLATGAACLVERLPIEVLVRPSLALLGSPVKKLSVIIKDERDGEKTSFALTGRGPLEYLDGLGLYTYDFSGKSVLDIASGNGRFAQMLNLVYGGTGTRALSIDLHSKGPFFGSRSHQQGDAYAMEFENKTFDLTINNWMFNYSLRRKFSKDEAKQTEMQRLANLLYEQLRVTRDGGEARIGFGSNYLAESDESVRLLHFLAKNHPRVEHAEVNRPYPFISGDAYLRVVMQPLTADGLLVERPSSFPELEELPILPMRRRGFQVYPTLGAVGVWALGKYFLFK